MKPVPGAEQDLRIQGISNKHCISSFLADFNFRFCEPPRNPKDMHRPLVTAAHVLDLSTRWVRRLLEGIRTDSAASIRHKAISRPSKNRISDGIRNYAMTRVRSL